MIEPGQLDERITIQRPNLGRDAAGGPVPKPWQNVAEVWARVVSSKGDEAFRAATMDAHRTIRLQIRWRDGVDTTMRVVWRDQNYMVLDIDESLRRRGELWLTARAQMAGEAVNGHGGGGHGGGGHGGGGHGGGGHGGGGHGGGGHGGGGGGS